MNFWVRICINVAVGFFRELCNAAPEIKEAAKKPALEIYRYIQLAFPDDPDFQ